MRRETGKEQRVQVPYDEGVANHIDFESCAVAREGGREALTGERAGQAVEAAFCIETLEDALAHSRLSWRRRATLPSASTPWT